jgi:hypothetical protein
VSGKYAFIDAEKARYPIVKMCIWLDVSTSGYYEWVDRPPSATAQRRTRLAALVQAIFDNRVSQQPCRTNFRYGPGCGSWVLPGVDD